MQVHVSGKVQRNNHHVHSQIKLLLIHPIPLNACVSSDVTPMCRHGYMTDSTSYYWQCSFHRMTQVQEHVPLATSVWLNSKALACVHTKVTPVIQLTSHI